MRKMSLQAIRNVVHLVPEVEDLLRESYIWERGSVMKVWCVRSGGFVGLALCSACDEGVGGWRRIE